MEKTRDWVPHGASIGRRYAVTVKKKRPAWGHTGQFGGAPKSREEDTASEQVESRAVGWGSSSRRHEPCLAGLGLVLYEVGNGSFEDAGVVGCHAEQCVAPMTGEASNNFGSVVMLDH